MHVKSLELQPRAANANAIGLGFVQPDIERQAMKSTYQSQIGRLAKEIADLRKAEARETRKEADVQKRISRATDAINRATTGSALKSRMGDLERASRDLAAVQKKRGEISEKVANKSKSLLSYQERQAREDEKERKKAAEEQRRLIREREDHERRMTSEIGDRRRLSRRSETGTDELEEYDFFVSHASEDKDGFVRGLAKSLRAKGAKVWYDEFTLKVGDSLREKIESGLSKSRFGIVVLSRHFFAKDWPQRELDGLWSLELGGVKRILPIWHEISKDEVVRHSPMLADKVALNTGVSSTEEIADRLCGMIHNDGEGDVVDTMNGSVLPEER